MKGQKTGGRAAGTPNRRSLEIAEILEQNGFDPDSPWKYWARVLKSHLAPLPRRGADKAEQFYQGRELVSDGEAGNHYEPVYARATADMANQAAKGLAPYIRPQLMRVLGTGKNDALVIEFAEDHTKLGTPGKAEKKPQAITMSVTASPKRRVREL